jgi:5-methylthioribose kinase
MAAAMPGPPPGGFVALDTATVLDYCAATPEVAAALGGTGGRADWSAREVGDGYINFVYVVDNGGGGGIIVKQGLPYLRHAGEAWPLTQERVSYEAEVSGLNPLEKRAWS